MLDSFQSRRGSDLLLAAALATLLAFGLVPMNRAEHAPDAATSQDPPATDEVSPLIDYLNAVGTATAAAEPSEPSLSVLLAGSAASVPLELAREARSPH